MANKENEKLAGEIRTLSEKLGQDAPKTDNMTTQQMNELLASMRQVEAGRTGATAGSPDGGRAGTTSNITNTQTQATSQKPVLSESGKLEEQKRETEQLQKEGVTSTTSSDSSNADQQQSEYRVAEGKSITTNHGEMLVAGAPISAKDLPDGDERLQALHKAGYVTKAGDPPKEDAVPPRELLPPAPTDDKTT